MKIAIAGIGYVGLFNTVLLSQNHEVKIKQLNNKIPPVVDTEIEDFLANKGLNFITTLDKEFDCNPSMSVRQGVDNFAAWYRRYNN
jgi:UDPglucose 6-dehydrogenase